MRRSTFLYTFLLLVVFLAAAAGILGTSSLTLEGRRWNAFDVVLVPFYYQIEEVHARLVASGHEPLDAYGATVAIEDFNGQQAIPVSEVALRFEPEDPRVDPFVEALPELFVTDGGEERYHVVYLPRNGSPLERYRELRRALADIEFTLVGWEPVAYAVVSIVAFLITAAVAVLSRQRIALGIVVAVLSGLYTLGHGPLVLVPAVLTGIAGIYALGRTKGLEREWLIHRSRIVLHEEQRWVLAFLLGAVVVGLAMIVIASGDAAAPRLVAYLLYLIAGAAAYLLLVTAEIVRLSRSEHRLFSPRPILGSPWRPRRAQPEIFPGLVGAIIVLVVTSGGFLLFDAGSFRGGGGVFIPQPEHDLLETTSIAGAEDARNLLRGLSGTDVLRHPLSVAGFFAHRRFQDSLVYGGTFEIPRPEEVVTLRRFRREDNRIVDWQEERLRFGASWVLDQYENPPGTAYDLFVEEGGMFTIVRTRLATPLASTELMLAQIALVFLVVFPVLLRIRLPYRGALGTVAVASRSERR
jgi:hypothetical protein